MDSNEIKEILVELGARRSDLKVISGWVSTKCVLAPWTHKKRSDSAPSAGVSLSDGHVYNCFTCGVKKPLHAVVAQYAEFTGEDLGGLVEELEDNAYFGPKTTPTWDELKQVNEEEVLMPLNEAVYMDLYDSAAGHPYLRKRGISDATARRLELMYDPEDPVDKEYGLRVPRILFPVRAPDGSLLGFSGRDVSGRSKVKVRDYHGLKKAHCVLGSHLITQDKPDKVLIVEGLFDYAKGQECGMPVGAVMHSSLTEYQANILRDFGLPVYPVYDNPAIDDAGAKGIDIAANMLFDYVPVMNIRYPEVWIEDENEEEGGHWLKDPGEMIKEDFEWIVADARPFLRKPYKKST